jgi:hypothetical protein
MKKKTALTADGPMIVHVVSPKNAEGRSFPALLVL